MQRMISALLLPAIVLCLLGGCVPSTSGTLDTSNALPVTTAPVPTTTTPEKQEAAIEKVLLINDRDIEIYFKESYIAGKHLEYDSFTVTDGTGTELALLSQYGGDGTIQFDGIVTVSLQSPVAADAALTLTYLETQEQHAISFDSYYKYEIQSASGITIRGSRALYWGEKTLKRAAEMVDIMLEKIPQIAQQMIDVGCTLVIYGPGETAYYIPENRPHYKPSNRYVEGLGGSTCSVTESNVWHWHRGNTERPLEDYYTAYYDENVLVHEFGHGIKISGFDKLADPSLREEYQMIYRHAKAAGLWPNSYAISNSDEYFATLSTIWFRVMNECAMDDFWDGVRGPINTRQELYNYDRAAYHFFAKLYPDASIGENWDAVADRVTITDMGNDPLPEVYERVDFSYPKPEVGVPLDKPVKITLAEKGYVARTTGKNASVILGYNTFQNYPGTADNGIYTLELESSEGNVYYAYIRNWKNGYLYADGNQIGSSADGSQKTLFTLTLDADAYVTIGCDSGYWQTTDMAAGKNITLGAEATRWQIEEVFETRYALFVHDCTADGSASGLYADAGQVITLTANVPEGKVFKGWVCSNGSVSDPESETTTFVMPEGDTVIWALYESIA